MATATIGNPHTETPQVEEDTKHPSPSSSKTNSPPQLHAKLMMMKLIQ